MFTGKRCNGMVMTLFAVVSLSVGLPAAGVAQLRTAVGPRVSTLGVGGELVVQVAPSIALRGAAHFLSFTRDEEIEGINYEITPELTNGSVLLDLHPTRGAFRITGGLVLNDNHIDFIATPTAPIEIGNMIFQPAEVGRLDGQLTVNEVAPYLGIGFAGRGSVSLSVDLGVVFHGTPQATLVGTTPLTGSAKAAFDAEVARELAEVQQAINDESLAKYYPVISIGLLIRL